MKRKVLSWLGLLLAGSIVLSSCESFSDLTPEEYGVWENHYIYRGNVRSKTTGEDAEKLVSSVSYGETDYEVSYCNDYTIRENDIYMCLTLNAPNGEFAKGIVKYNAENKTQENVFFRYEHIPTEGVTWVYEADYIEHAFPDIMLVYGTRTETSTDANGVPKTETRNLYYTIDYTGNLVEAESFYYLGYTKVSENYYTKTDYKDGKMSLYYLTWGMDEPRQVCDLDETQNVWKKTAFVEKNGVAGVLIAHYDLTETDQEHGNKLLKIEFFNAKTNATTLLFEGNTFVKWLEVPENEYFLTFTNKEITYSQKDGFLKPTTEHTTTVRQDCTLYKIDYANDTVSLKKDFTFESNKDFYAIQGIKDGTAYADCFWYETAAGCKKGGSQSQSYAIDIDDGKYKKIQSDELKASGDECFEYYALQNCPSFGEYAYYLQRKSYQTLNKTNYAYLLKRHNRSSKKTDVMQIWKSSGGNDQEEKYCQDMWKLTGGDIYEFIVRDY